MTVLHLSLGLSLSLMLSMSCSESRKNVELDASGSESAEDRELAKVLEDIKNQLDEQKQSSEPDTSSTNNTTDSPVEVPKQPTPGDDKKPPIQVANNPGGLRVGETASFSQNNLCIHVFGASTANGANVRSLACEGTDHQLFYTEYVNATDFRLIAKHSSKCVSVNAGLTTASANVNQQECLRNSDLREIFRMQAGEANLLKLQNVKSGLCLNMDGTGNIVQDRCELSSTLFQRNPVK